MDLNRHFIRRYAADWKEIGIQLSLTSDTLHSIGLDYRNQVIPSCRAMLQKWLQRDTTASWSKLFTAIESLAVVTSAPGKGAYVQ